MRDSGPIANYQHLDRKLRFMANCLHMEPGIYTFFKDVSVCGQDLVKDAYTFAVLDGETQPRLCKVTELVEIGGTLFAWLDTYPYSALTYDHMGVLHISPASLMPEWTDVLMRVGLSFAPLWHFTQKDGSITFVSKW